MRRRLVALCAAIAVIAATAVVSVLASAPPARAQFVPPPVMDEVVLELSAEDWVTTETARVVVAVEAAITGQSGAVRREMLNAVQTLADDAEWRLSRFDRSQDSAGLERWRATFEARLPETALGGIADRARQASRPGLQLSVETIDFSPTLAEVEATRAGLRREIYRQAGAELASLQAAFPERDFRIAAIQFDVDRPMMALARTQAAEMAPSTTLDAASDGPLNVARKLVTSARVVLSSLAPTAPEDGNPDDGGDDSTP